jgi:hypothetical protein
MALYPTSWNRAGRLGFVAINQENPSPTSTDRCSTRFNGVHHPQS